MLVAEIMGLERLPNGFQRVTLVALDRDAVGGAGGAVGDIGVGPDWPAPGETFGGDLRPGWFCSAELAEVEVSEVVLAVFLPPAEPFCPELRDCRRACDDEDYATCFERCDTDTAAACETVRTERLHDGNVTLARLRETVALDPNTLVSEEEALRILTDPSECEARFPGPFTPCDDVGEAKHTGCSVGGGGHSVPSHRGLAALSIMMLVLRLVRRSTLARKLEGLSPQRAEQWDPEVQ